MSQDSHTTPGSFHGNVRNHYRIIKRKCSQLKELTYLYKIIDFNDFINYLIKSRHYFPNILKELFLTLKQSLNKTDISDHLIPLLFETLMVKPRLIVELGVRGGESTSVFERVARLCGSILVGVDLEDCSDICGYRDWIFIQRDDLEFAAEFKDWSRKKMIQPQIDILSIDTSHLLEHTILEINNYFPYLSDKSKVFLHDTNLKEIYFRKDGSTGQGWNNERGVIRALEVYFNKLFDEERPFLDFVDPFLIKHNPYSCGFTILEKVAANNLNYWVNLK
jgi:hypothetical protein